jgi:endonuclease YncB( thermonuclease family)
MCRLFVMFVVLVIPPWALGAPIEIAGRATVVDGDTLAVNHKRVRLWGIDAPESAQQCADPQGRPWPCGRRAANALDVQLQGRTVRCQQRDVDRYGRSVAECFVRDESVNAWMVRSGWAVAYREYATAYVDVEQLARAGKRNLWQGAFQMPADYRRAERAKRAATSAASRTARAPTSGCRIKGNISSAGAKIFHMPGQRDYEQTRIQLQSGERYFCSAEEAIAAGWRAAKR